MWYTPYLMRNAFEAGQPRDVPEWAKQPAAVPVVASLGPIELARGCRRELGIRIRDRSALAVTGRELLVLTGRGTRTTVAARYPRHTALVVDFCTLPIGGDFLADRLVIGVGGVAIRADFDGRLHRDAQRVVAALGGVALTR
jgi:hypothetical protein